MPDGDIQLSVTLSAEDVKQKASQLRGEIEKIFNRTDVGKLDAGMRRTAQTMDDLANKAAILESELKAMETTSVANPEYEKTTQQLVSLEKEYFKVLKARDALGQAMAEGVTNAGKQDLENLEQALDSIIQRINEVTESRLKLEQSGKIEMTAMDADPAKYEAIKNELGEVNNQMSLTISKFNNGNRSISNFGSTTSKSVMQLGNQAMRVFKKLGSLVKSAISKIRSLARTVSSTLVKAFNKVKQSISKAFDFKSVKYGIRRLAQLALGAYSLVAIFRKLRNAAKEGLQNLVQYQSGTNATNKAMTELNSSLLYLKNAWAAAFAPVINYVMPILTQLIDYIAQVGNAIARFVGALTGQATVLNAVKVSAGDYAKSVSKAGSSAGGAAKKQKQLNDRLASFDDLNVLGKDKDTGSSGSGGGGAGGYTPDPSEMFEYVGAVSSLADMIKQAWTEGMGDFSDIGDMIGTKIKESLDNINWTTIKATADKLGLAFGSLLKGAFSVDGIWESIGITLGEGINTAIGFMHNFLTEITQVDWGGGIATALNSSIKTINWDTVWADIQLGADSLTANINSLFANLDLSTILSTISSGSESLTSAIVTLIDGINWDEIVSSALLIGNAIFEGIQQGLSGSDNPIFQSLGELIGELRGAVSELAPQVAPLFSVLAESGGEVISMFSQLIPYATKFFEQILPKVEPVLDSVVSIIGSLLDILGPILPIIGELASIVVPFIATKWEVFSEFLSTLTESLLPVFQSLLDNLQPVLDSIIENLLPLLTEALNTLSPVFDVIAEVLNTIFGVSGDITTRIIELTGAFGEDLLGALSPLSDILATVLDLFISLLDPILGLLDPLFDLLEVCLDPISLTLQLLGAILSVTVVPGLKIFSAIVKAVVVPVLTFLVNKIQAVIDIIHSLSVVTKALRTLFSDTFNGIKSVVYSVVNAILGAIEKFANGIVRGFNKVIDGLNSINFTIPDWVPDYGGESIGLNLSKLSTVSIPRLAQGAVIPPNKEFMAVLGDQTSGTNIEAPLDTIKQAVAEELSAQLDVLQNGFASVVQAINNKDLNIGDKQIGMANARYNARQNLIRGTSF